MWDVVVFVLQLVCVAILAAGAILSIWISFAAAPKPRSKPEPVRAADAIVKAAPKLKRAA
jgi:hypothetical protein